jgi:hypothetical protein
VEDPGSLLLALEERLLDSDFRKDTASVQALLTQEFREFGSSGRVFDRDAILQALAAEQLPAGPVAAISQFEVTLVAPDVALVTYMAVAAARRTLRSSLWVRREGRWLLLFHQGTLVGE